MVTLSQEVERSNKYHNDFIWFNNINDTTNAEYHGDIKSFIQRRMNQNNIPAMKQEVIDLFKWLNR